MLSSHENGSGAGSNASKSYLAMIPNRLKLCHHLVAFDALISTIDEHEVKMVECKWECAPTAPCRLTNASCRGHRQLSKGYGPRVPIPRQIFAREMVPPGWSDLAALAGT